MSTSLLNRPPSALLVSTRKLAADVKADRRGKSNFMNLHLRGSRVMDYLATRADWDGQTIVSV